MTRVPLMATESTTGHDEWSFVRALANSPGALNAVTQLSVAMRTPMELERAIREVVILRIGAVTNCQYEWRRHVRRARKLGMSDGEIASIRQMAPEVLPPESRLAAELAEAVERKCVTDKLWQSCKETFSNSQLVELVVLAGMYSMVTRVLLALDVELDPDILGNGFLDD
jgi:alkylhydroperoxidase family enzyme